MALDEALLIAAETEGIATVRFYAWREPTLSLGYFQSHAVRAGHAASAPCTVVRRASGGGAILHDRELTYSIALPHWHELADRVEKLYFAAHETLIETLAELNIAATLCEPTSDRHVPQATSRFSALTAPRSWRCAHWKSQDGRQRSAAASWGGVATWQHLIGKVAIRAGAARHFRFDGPATLTGSVAETLATAVGSPAGGELRRIQADGIDHLCGSENRPLKVCLAGMDSATIRHGSHEIHDGNEWNWNPRSPSCPVCAPAILSHRLQFRGFFLLCRQPSADVSRGGGCRQQKVGRGNFRGNLTQQSQPAIIAKVAAGSVRENAWQTVSQRVAKLSCKPSANVPAWASSFCNLPLKGGNLGSLLVSWRY